MNIQKPENMHGDAPTIEEVADSIRKIRKSKGWTLKDVEEASGGRWKAVVIGSYERCDRALSLNKAIALANFYQVPLDELLGIAPAMEVKSDRITFDIRKIRNSQEPSLKSLQSFISTLCTARRDWNGEVLSVRGADSLALAAAIQLPVAQLQDGLKAFDLIFTKPTKA